MSKHLKLMKEAETAGAFLTYVSTELGEMEFAKLIGLHPKDGMVYFKRGQAYETIGRPEKAEEDYRQAEKYFFDDEWRTLASEGVKRCRVLPRLNNIPEHLRAIWQDTLYFHQMPARCRPMVARAALQRTVEWLIHEARVSQTGNDLAGKLSDVKRIRPKIPESVLKNMETVKKHGDDAAHGADVTQDQAEICYKASLDVLRFISEH